MQKSGIIYRELKELNSPLADVPFFNVYKVPSNYFESLPANIISQIKATEITGIQKNPINELNVPEGYFDGLANEILQKIKQQENAEETESAILASIGKENVFRVPAGYFDQLSLNLINKVSVPAKVISINRNQSFYKYAVAALITCIISLSIFNSFNRNSDAGDKDFAFSVVKDAKDILNNNNDFENELSKLEEEDILTYLKNNGEDVDAALVASVINETNLPNEDAYIFDEQTLNNFLSQQHISGSSNN